MKQYRFWHATIILFLGLLVGFGCRSQINGDGTHWKDTEASLAELNQSFEGTLSWLTALYNTDDKAFHFASSSLNDPDQYICAIVPNIQIINALDSLNIIEQLSPVIKEGIIDYFRSRQAEDGYFRNTNPEFDKKEYEFLRAQMMIPGIEKKLGFKIDKPIPVTTVESYPELKTRETWISYLKNFDWSYKKNYQCASHTSTKIRTAVNALPEPFRSDQVDAYFEFVESIQSETTGLWSSDNLIKTHKAVSGAMKITLAYKFYNREIPMKEKLLETIIGVILNEHDVGDNYCYVRNPITTIQNIQSQRQKDLTDKQIYDIIKGTIAHHNVFRHTNGGFVRSVNFPFLGDASRPLSEPGIIEPNLNAIGQAIYATYMPLYALAGKKPPPLPGTKEFIATMNSKVKQ